MNNGSGLGFVSDSSQTTQKPNDNDELMEEEDEFTTVPRYTTDSCIPNNNGDSLKHNGGRYRPLKQVQEDYQRFTSMRQRGVSSVVTGNGSGDGSLTNPGTEVTIHCVNNWELANLSLCKYRFMQWM